MKHHHHVDFRTVLVTAFAVLLIGIFLTLGYGLIGLVFLFLAGSLLGGAMMSYLRSG